MDGLRRAGGRAEVDERETLQLAKQLGKKNKNDPTRQVYSITNI